MSDKPRTTHAVCGGKLTKLISAAGFQVKGTGWYVTDYARKGKSDGGGDSSKESKTDSTSSSAKETGSAEKTTEKSAKEKPPKSPSHEKSKKP